MRKEAAVVAVGIAISAVIVLGSLLREPKSPPPDKEFQESPPPPHAPWVEFYEERTGCGYTHPKTLLWIAVRHDDDGSWGGAAAELEGRPLGKTGLTALALLPFFGAGYTHLSKDLYVHEGGDWCFGTEIRKALAWLVKDQREDGTFRSTRDGDFDQVLAAFALSEAYGLTATTAWKRPAQLAVDALLKMQKADGFWEGAGPTAWAIVTLYSARLSELTVDEDAIDRALKSSRYPAHPGDALARTLLRTDAKEAIRSLMEESRERDPGNVAWWYLATLAMFAHEGRRGYQWYEYKPGASWEAWSPIMKEKLVPLFREDGSVEGKSPGDALVRTILAQMTLQLYYRYTNVFAPR